MSLCGLICNSKFNPQPKKTLTDLNDNLWVLFINVWAHEQRCIMARSWRVVSLPETEGIINKKMTHAIIHVY